MDVRVDGLGLSGIGLDVDGFNLDGLRVTQGGPDAYVGMLGLGCVQGGQLALVTGSR